MLLVWEPRKALLVDLVMAEEETAAELLMKKILAMIQIH